MNFKNWQDVRDIFDGLEKPYMRTMEDSLLLQRDNIRSESNTLVIRMLLDLDTRLRSIDNRLEELEDLLEHHNIN